MLMNTGADAKGATREATGLQSYFLNKALVSAMKRCWVCTSGLGIASTLVFSAARSGCK